MGLVSKDPEVGKRSLPLGHGVPGADVQEETSAVGALPMELLGPTRSSVQAVQDLVSQPCPAFLDRHVMRLVAEEVPKF